ncbi:hypothetical protein EA462_07615 [Natrarchaeobius halalkaliphilus]|uniref:Uncharacterized protein n=1 Tax=Natrarchaeobius halalkaliphilus TaxID=1679091 RepID=A0A3N6LLJ8_9EURY|nr:hypothetical protein [Natrarchaeobius halalkaliphilus]RQG89873.1 hypothetical protein EA462_07615 [Natrarchaeobius halalkaliphilus]
MTRAESDEINLLDSPTFRYGIAASTTAILFVVAFWQFDGTVRWIVVALALANAVIVPRRLAAAAEQG